jgi:hypothetical protein
VRCHANEPRQDGRLRSSVLGSALSGNGVADEYRLPASDRPRRPIGDCDASLATSKAAAPRLAARVQCCSTGYRPCLRDCQPSSRTDARTSAPGRRPALRTMPSFHVHACRWRVQRPRINLSKNRPMSADGAAPLRTTAEAARSAAAAAGATRLAAAADVQPVADGTASAARLTSARARAIRRTQSHTPALQLSTAPYWCKAALRPLHASRRIARACAGAAASAVACLVTEEPTTLNDIQRCPVTTQRTQNATCNKRATVQCNGQQYNDETMQQRNVH